MVPGTHIMGSDLIRWDGEGSLKTDTELDLRDETGKRRGQADFGNNNGMCKGPEVGEKRM